MRKLKYILYFLYYGFLLKRISFKNLSYEWKKNPINRTVIINFIIKKIIEQNNINNINNINYLEIGCFDNANFNNINFKNINKIGVDPVSGGNFRTTSDKFFLKNKTRFDCIFIDGLHIYEQVQKDFLNSLKFLKKGGYIILHDCIPRNFIEENIPRFPSNKPWTGDVWKVCMEITKNPEMNFKIFMCDNGVGVFKKDKDNNNYYKLNYILKNKRFKYFLNYCFPKIKKIEVNSIDKLNDYI